MKIFITGVAGFIGSHLVSKLLSEDHEIYGIDNMNDYYDPEIKNENIKIIREHNKSANFIFEKEDLLNTDVISKWKPDIVIHLAGMAGVRNSIENPEYYMRVNVEGITHLLQESVKSGVSRFIYASSSSVYGRHYKIPFKESDICNNINSPYACSKKCCELIAKLYSDIYQIKTIGLRFFTVYGPRGRPDMAPYKFLKAISEEKPINKYGNGTSMRDYTYVSDIVDGINGAINYVPQKNVEIFNLGNNSPYSLNEFIKICENVVGKKAIINQMENQKGDVNLTYACIKKAKAQLGYNPQIKLEEGLKKVYESF
jgi:UDP-glucuronate 4-epimerase